MNKAIFTEEQEKAIAAHVEKRYPIKYHKDDPVRENYEQAYRKSILAVQLSNEEKKN